jgi:hypothetical protein
LAGKEKTTLSRLFYCNKKANLKRKETKNAGNIKQGNVGIAERNISGENSI